MGIKDKLAYIQKVLNNRMLTPSEKLDRITIECNSLVNTEKQKVYSIKEIEVKILNHFEITDVELQSKTRKHKVVLARQVGHYLSNLYTKESLATIGNHFGGKSHCTVIWSSKKIENYLNCDKKFILLHEDFINSFKK